jgi:hypothetical protein
MASYGLPVLPFCKGTADEAIVGYRERVGDENRIKIYAKVIKI